MEVTIKKEEVKDLSRKPEIGDVFTWGSHSKAYLMTSEGAFAIGSSCCPYYSQEDILARLNMHFRFLDTVELS